MENVGDRIRSARKAKGLTQTQLGDACGASKAAVAMWESNKSKPASAKYKLIAAALEVSAEWLITGVENSSGLSDHAQAPFGAVAVNEIPLLGEVQAGAFEAVLEKPRHECSLMAYGNDKGLPVDALYALKVKGDSMDKDFTDGSTIICLDIYKHPIQLKPGHRVIVHSRHPHMDAWEATVKELRHDKDEWILQPNSTNPMHLPIRIPNGNGEEFHHGELGDIRIVAVVIDSQKSWI